MGFQRLLLFVALERPTPSVSQDNKKNEPSTNSPTASQPTTQPNCQPHATLMRYNTTRPQAKPLTKLLSAIYVAHIHRWYGSPTSPLKLSLSAAFRSSLYSNNRARFVPSGEHNQRCLGREKNQRTRKPTAPQPRDFSTSTTARGLIAALVCWFLFASVQRADRHVFRVKIPSPPQK